MQSLARDLLTKYLAIERRVFRLPPQGDVDVMKTSSRRDCKRHEGRTQERNLKILMCAIGERAGIGLGHQNNG